MKKIFLTGCCGFIASHILDKLLSLGAKVIGIDNLSNGSEKNIEHIKNPDFEFIEEDICSFDYKIMKDVLSKCDVVNHQAALGSVPRSIKNPSIYAYNNIFGTVRLMQLSCAAGIKRFVYASSSSIHSGNSPYALSKKTIEDFAKQFWEYHGLETIGLRYFNVFGPRQNGNSAYAAVIPKWINLIREKKDIEIYGDGSVSRDFTYIDNVVDINIRAMHALSGFGESFDVGCGASITLNQLAEIITKNTYSRIKHGYSRNGDAKYSRAIIEDTKTIFNWTPEIDFETGIKKLMEMK